MAAALGVVGDNNPEVITSKGLALSAASRWKATYSRDMSPEGRRIHGRLLRLKDPEPEDVAAVIGNSSWTTLRCQQCNEVVKAVVVVGEPLGWDSATAQLCLACVTKAADLLRRAT